jgi:hypothetical protein
MGVLAIIKFISNDHGEISNQVNIVYGILSIIAGIYFIEKPDIIGSIIPLFMGVVIIISSSLKIRQSFDFKNVNSSYFFWSFLTSLLSLICGVILLFNPFKGAVLITRIIGIFLVIYAVLDICNAIIFQKGSSLSIKVQTDDTKQKNKKDKKTKDAKIIREVKKEEDSE